MTEMFMNDEEVVHLGRVPHIITSETIVTSCSSSTPTTSRIQASAAAIELGRRLLLASRSGDTQAVLDLMAKGAPFTTDWLGTCPLHLAASNNHAATCAVLLRAGAGRDARTKVERTPLHLAAAHGHLDAARLLLAYGANVHCRDMLRMTPLHWAAQRGHTALASLLLRYGADARLRDKFHKTPATLAAARGDSTLAAMLAEAAKQPPQLSEDANENVEKSEEKQKEDEYETIEEIEEDAIPMETEDEQTNEIKIEGQQDISMAGARLLRAHGITLLSAHDARPPLLAAIDCGRTLVLSDAGKLMLKESEESMPPPATKPTSPLKVTVNQKKVILTPTSQRNAVNNATNQKGVVLTATPVKTPPRPGVKIFTINDKLTLSKENVNTLPIVKKVANAQDVQLKLVQVPSDDKMPPIVKTPMKAKVRMNNISKSPIIPPPPVSVSDNQGKPLVKIIMNKNNYNKLIATANKASTAPAGTMMAAMEQSTVVVPEQFVRSQSVRFLRSQLLAAHAKLHALNQQLQHYRTRLQRYEDVT